MKGARSRSVERIRVTARCRTCGRLSEGETTIEHRPWEHREPRRYHFCDDCLNELLGTPERPLELVLRDLIAR